MDISHWKIGDIVCRGSSECEIIAIDNRGDGDYAHVKVRCLVSNDDWLPVGDTDETFAEHLHWMRAAPLMAQPAPAAGSPQSPHA